MEAAGAVIQGRYRTPGPIAAESVGAAAHPSVVAAASPVPGA